MGIFEKAIAQGEQVLEYIPQRNPIVMVDTLWEVTDNSSISGLMVCADNMFCKDNLLQDSGVVEHIAQSAALRIGYIYKNHGKNIPIGFIGSINKFILIDLPKVGERLRTEIIVEREVFGITLLTAKVEINGRKIAECQMKVAIVQN